MNKNIDKKTVESFGHEWETFDHSDFNSDAIQQQFERYFSLLDWSELDDSAIVFDLGCGSGRWAKFVAPRVGHLHLIDASHKALNVARQNLQEFDNCDFHHASVDTIPLDDNSADFAYSLGVLHHVPDTRAGIQSCVNKLKPGAPFLIYLYYAFDNKPRWFRAIWQLSECFRASISRLPQAIKLFCCKAIALLVYLPLARISLLLEKAGFKVDNIPLSAYRSMPFYMMQNDALDRFGTQLEHRFSRIEIETMLIESGLENIVFRDDMPFWCAIAYKRRNLQS